ncbi:hypothetical protein QJS10_CPB15g00845 [Acorus calamus]|uniref:Uncharacterized protein n=1 Tax=Acorus calamus TaxID=4465 RepID=A0AAV9D696_ACOCL|nr:hypothetical protein QJS10_CPB15g00845 [Acorus calamus]
MEEGWQVVKRWKKGGNFGRAGPSKSMFKDANGAVDFPPLFVSLWTNKDASFPPSVLVCFGGWTVPVKIEDCGG